jgi:nicotinate phosphoribosyltransferase
MFHTASADDIKGGEITDVYFRRTVEVLRAKGIRRHAAAEVRTTSLPGEYGWAVLAGIEEVVELMSGLPVTVRSMPEGTVFHAGEPVLTVEGEYTDYAVYETALLGLICQSSGVATKAARCRIAAGERYLVSFGARRMHPSVAPAIERSAYIGGCDGVAVVRSADLLSIPASGTMPHALVLVVGDSAEAFRMYHEALPADLPRVCLVDTMCDEKHEAVAAAEALGPALQAVRLDTPSSRRGDMGAILDEVRWELDLRGYRHVQLFVSGSMDEGSIQQLNPQANGYGVGTAISNAPCINFALDIVEVDGEARAKRGKKSGRKSMLRCAECGRRRVVPVGAESQCECGGAMDDLLQPLLEKGRPVRELPSPAEIREYALSQLSGLELGAG